MSFEEVDSRSRTVGFQDARRDLQERVRQAFTTKAPLAIQGAGTKSFYGRVSIGQPLDLSTYRGIVDYEPTELVVTVRAGTPLVDLAVQLAEYGQMLPFEPPAFGAGATIGGTIACGFAGPRRPYAGGARDFVLGVTCINGQGQYLRFGGRVMKNVAGFDVSRLLAGSLGTLGVLLDISLKVLPRPATELTLMHEVAPDAAIRWMNIWAGQPLPLTGACYSDGRLYVRLAGAASAVKSAAESLGGDKLTDPDAFWEALREHTLPFFARQEVLWRIVVPPATPPMDLPGASLLDWGGAQRWLFTQAPRTLIEQSAAGSGGYAHAFRNGNRDEEVFAPQESGVAGLLQRVKHAFDPARILNPGRMYSYL